MHVKAIQTPQRRASWTHISHPRNLSKPKTHRVASSPSPSSSSLPLPPLPPRATRGRAQKGRACQAQHMALGLGTTEVEVPAGPFSFNTHTYPPLDTHLRRTGKAHSRPCGRSEATGTAIPQSHTPLFPLSSPPLLLPLSCRLRPAHVIRQTVSCCITHTPLCPCLRRSEPCSLM